MAKIFNGMIPFASAIQPTGAQPLDDRVVVATMADLIDATTFGDAKYNGMLVAVVETQQVYMLVDDVNSTNSDSWVQVGTDFSGDISDISDRVDVVESILDDVVINSTPSGLDLTADVLRVKIDAKDNNALTASPSGLYAASYDLSPVENPAEGYASQYVFTKHGATGDETVTINIPKDQVLKNAEILSVEEENLPYTGAKVGDKYIKFEFQNNNTPQYLAVQDLVDVYTADEVYINMSESNVITLDIAAVTNRVSQNLNIANLSSTVSDHTAILNGTNNDGLVANVAKNTADIVTTNANVAQNASDISGAKKSISGLVAEFTGFKELGVVNEIDDTKINGIGLTTTSDDKGRTIAKIDVDINTLATAVIEAADIPAENISVSNFGPYENSNVQAVLESLSDRITTAAGGGVQSLVATVGKGVSVTTEDNHNFALAVKTSDLVVSGSALTVTDNKIDICWSEL